MSMRPQYWSWYQDFLTSLYEPEDRCTCGHFGGSHNYGFSGHVCMWCPCTRHEGT